MMMIRCLAVAVVGVFGVALAGPALAGSCEKYKQRAHGPLTVRQVVENKTGGNLKVSWFKHSTNDPAAFTATIGSGKKQNYDFNSGKGKKVTSYVTVKEADATCQVTTKNTDTGNGNFYEASCDVGKASYAAKCDRTFNSGAQFYYWVITYTFFDTAEGSDPSLDPSQPM